MKSLEVSSQTARVLAQYRQLAVQLARQSEMAYQAAGRASRTYAGPNSAIAKVAGAMTRRQEAVTRIADSQAMSDLAHLRNRLVHLHDDHAGVVEKFAQQHEAVLRLLDERTRSMDFQAWNYYVWATGTVAAPRDARGKPVIVLTGRDTRHRPYLAGFLREQGWHVLELRPYDDRSAFSPQQARRDQMLGYDRRSDRGQARAPCARDHRLKGCPDEIALRADLMQQPQRQVGDGAHVRTALRLSAGRLYRGDHSSGHRLGATTSRMDYRRVDAAGFPGRRVSPSRPACADGAA